MGSFGQTSLKWKISCKCTFKLLSSAPSLYIIIFSVIVTVPLTPSQLWNNKCMCVELCWVPSGQNLWGNALKMRAVRFTLEKTIKHFHCHYDCWYWNRLPDSIVLSQPMALEPASFISFFSRRFVLQRRVPDGCLGVIGEQMEKRGETLHLSTITDQGRGGGNIITI